MIRTPVDCYPHVNCPNSCCKRMKKSRIKQDKTSNSQLPSHLTMFSKYCYSSFMSRILTNRTIIIMTLFLILVMTPCCRSSPSVKSRTTKKDNRLTLHAAGFFPTSTKIPEGAIGRGVIPAVELALQHINDSPKILRGIHLDLVWNDTEVSLSNISVHFYFHLILSCFRL